jgi:hypothetical protein
MNQCVNHCLHKSISYGIIITKRSETKSTDRPFRCNSISKPKKLRVADSFSYYIRRSGALANCILRYSRPGFSLHNRSPQIGVIHR